jgi:hypothetical protein
MSARALIGVAVLAALAISTAITAARTAPKLDYEFFKSRVEPVFMTKRPDHARSPASLLASAAAGYSQAMP